MGMTGNHILDENAPTVNPIGASPNDYFQIQANPDDFGASVGKAQQGLGNAFEQAGVTGIDVATQRQNIHNDLIANDGFAGYTKDAVSAWGDYQRNNQGQSAITNLGGFQKNLDTLRQQYLLSMPSDSARVQLDNVLRRVQTHFLESGQNYADQESKRWNINSWQNGAATAGDSAVLFKNDPRTSETWLNTSDEQIRNLYDDNGSDPATKARAIQENRGKNVERLVDQYALTGIDGKPDIVQAQAVFDKYKSQMDVGSQQRIERLIAAHADQQIGQAAGQKAWAVAHAGRAYADPSLPVFAQTSSAFPGAMSPQGLARTVQIESSGNPTAGAGTSHVGLVQASPAYWNRFGEGSPTDPNEAIKALGRSTSHDRPILAQVLGRDPSDAELYVAHQQGVGGATALFQNPNERAGDVLFGTGAYKTPAAADAAITGNGGDANAPASAFTGKWIGKFSGPGGSIIPGGGQTMTMPASVHGVPRAVPAASGDLASTLPSFAQAPDPATPAFSAISAAPTVAPPALPATLEQLKATAIQNVEQDPALSYEAKQVALRTINQTHNAMMEMSTGLSSEIAQAEKQIVAGYDVPQASWNDIQARVKQNGITDLQQQFATANEIRNNFRSLKGQSPGQVAAFVQSHNAALLTQGATPQQFQVAEAANLYLQRLTHDVEADPLSRAAQDRVVTSIKTMNILSNPKAFADAFAARIPQAEAVAQFYGRPVEYLLPSERESIKELAAAGGQPMQQVASTIIDKLGPRAGAFFKEIGGVAPQFAHLGRLQMLGADQSTLSDLSAFQRISQDKDASKQIVKLPEATVQLGAQDSYKSAFQAMPEFAGNAKAAAQKLLEIRSLRNGTDPKDASKADTARAFQEAAGARFDGNVQYGGVGSYKPSFWSSTQTVPVPPGVRADALPSIVSAVKDADVAASPPMAGDLKSLIPMATVAKGNLVAAAHGAYWVAMGDPLGRDPQWVMNKDGGKFLLDLNALEPALRARVPGGYRPRGPGASP